MLRSLNVAMQNLIATVVVMAVMAVALSIVYAYVQGVAGGQATEGLAGVMIGVALGAAVASGLVIWSMGRIQIRQQGAIAQEVEQLLQGNKDLSVRLSSSGGLNESSRLVLAINQLLENTEQMIIDLSSSSSSLSALVGEVSELSSHAGVGCKAQCETTERVSSSMKEMATAIHQIAERTSVVSKSAVDIRQRSSSGESDVNAVKNGLEHLSGEVSSATDMIALVDQDSERIGSVLDVIRGIAEQTNLLALNAAIEAARAGEQGRGFAVVADEVRSLAQRTQQSTQEIQEMISSLQGGVKKTVEVMGKGRELANESLGSAEKAHQALSTMAQEIDSIMDVVSQVAGVSKEQSSAVEKIDQDMSGIANIAASTLDDSYKSQSACEQLADGLGGLIEIAGAFQTRDRYGYELRKAKNAHLAWKTKLRGFLDGKSTLDSKAAVSHNDCLFGKWYNSVGKREMGHLAEMKQIHEPHRELHEVIRRIIELKQAGKSDEAEQEFKKVDPLSKQIVGLLDQVIENESKPEALKTA